MSATVQSLRVNPRYDLQSPFVLISYEQTQTINGVTWMQPVTDQYPAVLPTDPLSFFNGLRFTVDLQGVNATTTEAILVCALINPTNSDWWIARHPQYTEHDLDPSAADDKIPIDSFIIDPTTVTRRPTNADEIDKGYTNELIDGSLTEWMTFKAQRVTVSCRATITLRNGHVIVDHPVTYQLNSTTATSGTYKNTQFTQYAEPLPVGLAQQLYNAVSVLQFEGELVLQEEDCSGSLGIGQLFNVTGGALAEWSTMNAMVQRVTENLDTGQTTIEFGPPRTIGAGELVDLLRVNRFRKISYSVGLALGQAGSGSNSVPAGKNTSEKNSASTPGYTTNHVVSSTIDGSGPVTTTAAGFTQWSPAGPVNPGAPYPAGSVTINLSDAAGATLKIQKLPVCQDGIKGTMYFLCSVFVADP